MSNYLVFFTFSGPYILVSGCFRVIRFEVVTSSISPITQIPAKDSSSANIICGVEIRYTDFVSMASLIIYNNPYMNEF